MRSKLFLLLAIFVIHSSIAQVTIKTKEIGNLVFKELDYGIARIKQGVKDSLQSSPTGLHGWLDDFEIVKTSDSIEMKPNANFGVIYIVEAKDTLNIPVTIEWIYPKSIENDEGEKFESIKYTTSRPTNIPSASSYGLEEPYEMVKGKWHINIYIAKILVCSKDFFLW